MYTYVFFNPFLFLLFDFFDESIFLASLSHLLLHILFKLDYILIISLSLPFFIFFTFILSLSVVKVS